MGAFLDKPKTEKHNEIGEGNGLRYALSSMQGWRVEMEDAHTAAAELTAPGLKDWSFFAVFDGHAGGKVSACCSKSLMEMIISNDDFKGKNSSSNENNSPQIESVIKGIKTGFLSLDDRIREMPEMINGEDKSGSTAVCTLMSPTNLFFGNCGDSRALLCRDSRVVFSTQDHKPTNPAEKDRITKAGGSVMIQRVNGSLAVSRALGDFEYKNVTGMGPCEQLVSPEPDISVQERSELDEFIILACDGIWDVMSNDELCEFVRNRMQLTNDLKEVCNQVVDTCLNKGSRDNMSIVIVAFPGAPSLNPELVKKEEQLNTRLESKIKEILENADPGDAALPYLMHLLSVEEIEGLPPGGGLSAKRSTVEEILHRLDPMAAARSADSEDS